MLLIFPPINSKTGIINSFLEKKILNYICGKAW